MEVISISFVIRVLMINKDNFIANLYSVIYLINVKDIVILMNFFKKICLYFWLCPNVKGID